MIESTMIERRVQTPDEGYDWLYRSAFQTIDGVTTEIRSFTKKVSLGIYDAAYEQCTQADKDKWDEEHKPTPIEPTYEEKVVSLIRQKYDVNQELHALRCRDTEPERFVEYDIYVKECLEKAKEGQV